MQQNTLNVINNLRRNGVSYILEYYAKTDLLYIFSVKKKTVKILTYITLK